MKVHIPARLHVLLASRARVGVVFRRGPTNSVCSILWDRKEDRFEVGQWLRARIYERRADISPDGRHMIYFARNARWSSETGGSWTAISRVPWLKADVLLGKGDCWHGGGLFTSNTAYWVNDGYGHKLIRDTSKLKRDEKFRPSGSYGGECPSVYYVRLQRDGWTLNVKLGALFDSCTVFEKPLPRGWILRKLAHEQVGAPPGKGCYWDEHELEHSPTKQRFEFPNWEWADVDGDRLVWAAEGCLFESPLPRAELGESRVLHDFNDMKFEAIEAPY